MIAALIWLPARFEPRGGSVQQMLAGKVKSSLTRGRIGQLKGLAEMENSWLICELRVWDFYFAYGNADRRVPIVFFKP
jgi:hypothetical protein